MGTTDEQPASADGRAPLTGRMLAAGGIAGFAVNGIKTALQLVSLPVMARLLTPADFGLYSLALPVVSFAAMLADAGLGASLARESEANIDVWSTAWWFLVGLGVTLAASLCVAGALLGSLTHQPRLPGLVMLMSLALIGMTLGIVPGARLDRRGRLLVGAGVELAAVVTGFAVAIASALDGAGVLSLAAQFVATVLVRSIMVNVAAFHPPGWRFRPRLLREHLGTGAAQISGRLIDLVDRLASNAVLQRTIGIESLGSYTFGTQVARFATEAVGNPCWLLLYLQAVRGEPTKTQRLHQQICRVLGLLLLPATLIGAVAAPGLVGIILGPRWLPASQVISLVLPFYALNTINAQAMPLLLAFGRYSLVLWCAAGGAVLRVSLAAAGGWIGLRGIAIGADTIIVVQCVALTTAARTAAGIAPGAVLAKLFGPAAAGVFGVGAFLLLSSTLVGSHAAFFASLAVAAAAAFLCLLVLDRPHLADDLALVRRLVTPAGKRRAASGVAQPEQS